MEGGSLHTPVDADVGALDRAQETALAQFWSRYRARDLLKVPSVLSLARIPLAIMFPVVSSNLAWALAVVATAGVSDLADGWYARRYRQETATGAMLDPLTDKIFVGVVLVTLVVQGYLPLLVIAALATRELGELPLVVWLAFRRMGDRNRVPRSNILGKWVTLLQFAVILATMLGHFLVASLVLSTAIVGAISAMSYWQGVLGMVRGRTREPELN